MVTGSGGCLTDVVLRLDAGEVIGWPGEGASPKLYTALVCGVCPQIDTKV